MFHSAALRLTTWYLAIIMAISLIFSGLLYSVSVNDLNHNLNRQIGYFNNFLGPGDYNNYVILRNNQLDQDKSHLRASLVLFNILVLAGGGLASYWLARRTLRPIETALQAQSRFAADASHELRTPLAAIQAENEVALRNPALKKAEAVSLLKSNLEEVAKLRALSEGLLRLASSRGRIEHPQAVALQNVIPKSIERLAKAAQLKGIKVESENLKNISVRGEPDGLIELFAIFIDNAIKYSPTKSKVTVSAKVQHKNVQVTISDQGRGIPPTDLPMIFDRFYQSDSSRSKRSSGYGLGLAIAKKITDAHQGHIEVRSTPGKGSAFIVHLPSA
ncbi:MAG TPA: HAMP domain-containing sensor histidine kinase [Candidatus Saccharimonadales bacterium]|nr:HAMP domain-containing sensor histidine kinase [Candidatus Saccharimonadales bacterium]